MHIAHNRCENTYEILFDKPEGRIPRRRCEDNIVMNLRDIWWEDVDWIRLARGKDL
jgi:hypothetical protein